MTIRSLIQVTSFLLVLCMHPLTLSAQSEDEELMMRPNPEEFTGKIDPSRSSTGIDSNATDIDPADPISSPELKIRDKDKQISNVKGQAGKGTEKMGIVLEDKKPRTMVPAGIDKQGMKGKKRWE